MGFLISVIVSGLAAVPPGPGRGGPPHGRPPAPGGPPHNISTFVERVAEVVNASQEQVKQLDAIAMEHQEAAEAVRTRRQEVMEVRREEINTLRQEMREARRAGNNERIRELQGQIREIIPKRPHELMRETHDRIAAILTDEQRTAFQEMITKDRPGGKGRRPRGDRPGWDGGDVNIYRFTKRVADAVNPTDEQRQQLRKIAADHIRALKAAEANRDIARQEYHAALECLHRQLREARKAGDEEQVRTVGDEIRGILGAPVRDVMKSTHDKIEAILIDEQKSKFEALVKEARGHVGQRFRERGDRFRGKRGGGKKHVRPPLPPDPPAEP